MLSKIEKFVKTEVTEKSQKVEMWSIVVTKKSGNSGKSYKIEKTNKT